MQDGGYETPILLSVDAKFNKEASDLAALFNISVIYHDNPAEIGEILVSCKKELSIDLIK